MRVHIQVANLENIGRMSFITNLIVVRSHFQKFMKKKIPQDCLGFI